MKYHIVLVSLLLLFAQPVNAQDSPERAILLIIDGLHVEAPERLEMPTFNDLSQEGALVERTTTIMPHHPTHGEYAEVHTSSFPNPIMMAGTVFLEPGQTMLQHGFENTAFVANTSAYQSITDGYDYVVQRGGSDAFAIDRAVEILENDSIDFMRVHLQSAGSAGSQSLTADSDQPYRHNIWHEEAPYVEAIEEADRQLQRFVSSLKEMQKWENTLLVVTSDHGQTKTGWHPTLPEESWLVPTVFHGPGVPPNRTVEWADLTDVAPTIAHLMDVPKPNEGGGAGRVIHDVIRSTDDNFDASSKILELNRVIGDYMRREAEMISNSEEHPYLNSLLMRLEREFYGLDRIMDWKDVESIDALIENNRHVVEEMEAELERVGESE